MSEKVQRIRLKQEGSPSQWAAIKWIEPRFEKRKGQ